MDPVLAIGFSCRRIASVIFMYVFLLHFFDGVRHARLERRLEFLQGVANAASMLESLFPDSNECDHQ
jgi:hypothetical protein